MADVCLSVKKNPPFNSLYTCNDEQSLGLRGFLSIKITFRFYSAQFFLNVSFTTSCVLILKETVKGSFNLWISFFSKNYH